MRYLALGITILAIGGLALFLFLGAAAEEIAVERGTVVAWEELEGKVVAEQEYPLTLFRQAKVLKSLVGEGESVKPGDSLLLLRGDGQEIEVKAHRSGRVSFLAPKGELAAGSTLVKISDELSRRGQLTLAPGQSPQVGEKIKVLAEADYLSEVVDLNDQELFLRLPKELPVGQSIRGQVVLAFKENVLRLPPAAIFTKDGEYFVARKRLLLPLREKVEIGLRGNEFWEIISSFKEGEKVVRQAS